MTYSDTPRVIFFQVRDNGTKLKRIVETAQTHFELKEHLLFFTEDEKSQTFVDELLWKSHFLPHLATDLPTSDYIAITKVKKNLNTARIAFNLCSTPLLLNNFRMIYDFEDLTAPNKQQLSTLKFDAYKREGWLIEAR
jgi:DNA polymerase-3 subunit chi